MKLDSSLYFSHHVCDCWWLTDGRCCIDIVVVYGLAGNRRIWFHPTLFSWRLLFLTITGSHPRSIWYLLCRVHCGWVSGEKWTWRIYCAPRPGGTLCLLNMRTQIWLYFYIRANDLWLCLPWPVLFSFMLRDSWRKFLRLFMDEFECLLICQ